MGILKVVKITECSVSIDLNLTAVLTFVFKVEKSLYLSYSQHGVGKIWFVYGKKEEINKFLYAKGGV